MRSRAGSGAGGRATQGVDEARVTAPFGHSGKRSRSGGEGAALVGKELGIAVPRCGERAASPPIKAMTATTGEARTRACTVAA